MKSSFVDDDSRCTDDKHSWMYSCFCDRCGEYFEDWVKEIPKKVASEMLGMLQAIINEQVQTRSLKHETEKYIMDAVKDQARRMGWI
jgi:hypothetical protein